MMNFKSFMKNKISIKNIWVLLLVVASFVVALFTSPFYLGTNYSKGLLIDNYCRENTYGSSFIINSNLNTSNCNYDDVINYKNNFDSEFNTIFNIANRNSTVNGDKCNVVGASKSNSNNYFNKYRVYSDNGWSKLTDEEYVYIPQTMASTMATNIKDVIGMDIDIYINEVLYTFKIAGYFNDVFGTSGWRLRGRYFSNYFDNCIFIDEDFLADKFDCAFEMFTSDTSGSGNIYNNFINFVSGHEGSLITPKDLKEIQLLEKISLLDKTKRNEIVRALAIVISVAALVVILFFSIRLFDVENIRIRYKWSVTFIWGAIYYALSCAFILIFKNKLIELLGFSAFGGNEAFLSILLCFFIVLFIGISIKTFISYRREKSRLDKENANPTKTVLFITKAKFPNDNAFATYLGAIASIYKKAGYDVVCVGNGYTPRSQINESYFGKYISLRNNSSSLISKIFSHLLFESRVFRFLDNNYEKPTHIFFSCEFSIDFYYKIKKIYSDLGVGFSFIVTEEYTKDEFEKYNLLARNSLNVNHYFLDKYDEKEDSFIVISKYLQNKLNDRQIKNIYVPFSFNQDYVSSVKKDNIKHDGINYIYCGNPENKDLLPVMLNVFSNLNEEIKKKGVRLSVVGVDDEWAIRHGVQTIDKDVIKFYGRRDRDFVIYKYAESDYSVLLRDEDKTFAKAGFPTKISESMTFGVVPITNLSSNLSDYLNKENAIIVNGHKEENFVEAISTSINEVDSLSKRKKNAIMTAQKAFNIETYKDELLSLINDK